MQGEDICAEDGCDRAVSSRGYCDRHYRCRLKDGTLPLLRKRGVPCSVEGCDRPHRVHGLCRPHHDRLSATGELGGNVIPRIGDIVACHQCGTEFPAGRPNAMYCSRRCAMRAGRGYGAECAIEGCNKQHTDGRLCDKHLRNERLIAAGVKPCLHCGQTKPLDDFYFAATGTAQRSAACRECTNLLSKQWRQKNPEAYRASSREYGRRPEQRARNAERTQVRRARIAQAFVEDVDRLKVYWAHMGRCGICGETVPLDAFHVDHIVPLAAGGEHSYANTQPAHPACNLRKGGRAAA